MDPITHAAAGAVAMLALRRRPPHCVLVGALAAASPDADIVFSGDPLNTLLLHRGITHALPAVPFFAFLLALLALPLLGRASGRPCLALHGLHAAPAYLAGLCHQLWDDDFFAFFGGADSPQRRVHH